MVRFDESRSTSSRIILSKQNLDDFALEEWCRDYASRYCQGRASRRYLEVLDVSGNLITGQGARFLARWLKEHSICVRDLKLYMNELGDECAQDIAELLSDENAGLAAGMRELHLSHTGLKEKGLWLILRPIQEAKPKPPLWLRIERNEMDAEMVVSKATQYGLRCCWFVQGQCKPLSKGGYCCNYAHVHMFAGFSQERKTRDVPYLKALPAPEKRLALCDQQDPRPQNRSSNDDSQNGNQWESSSSSWNGSSQNENYQSHTQQDFKSSSSSWNGSSQTESYQSHTQHDSKNGNQWESSSSSWNSSPQSEKYESHTQQSWNSWEADQGNSWNSNEDQSGTEQNESWTYSSWNDNNSKDIENSEIEEFFAKTVLVKKDLRCQRDYEVPADSLTHFIRKWIAASATRPQIQEKDRNLVQTNGCPPRKAPPPCPPLPSSPAHTQDATPALPNGCPPALPFRPPPPPAPPHAEDAIPNGCHPPRKAPPPPSPVHATQDGWNWDDSEAPFSAQVEDATENGWTWDDSQDDPAHPSPWTYDPGLDETPSWSWEQPNTDAFDDPATDAWQEPLPTAAATDALQQPLPTIKAQEVAIPDSDSEDWDEWKDIADDAAADGQESHEPDAGAVYQDVRKPDILSELLSCQRQGDGSDPVPNPAPDLLSALLQESSQRKQDSTQSGQSASSTGISDGVPSPGTSIFSPGPVLWEGVPPENNAVPPALPQTLPPLIPLELTPMGMPMAMPPMPMQSEASTGSTLRADAAVYQPVFPNAPLHYHSDQSQLSPSAVRQVHPLALDAFLLQTPPASDAYQLHSLPILQARPHPLEQAQQAMWNAANGAAALSAEAMPFQMPLPPQHQEPPLLDSTVGHPDPIPAYWQ